jgi:hypothetical protein
MCVPTADTAVVIRQLTLHRSEDRMASRPPLVDAGERSNVLNFPRNQNVAADDFRDLNPSSRCDRT